MANAIKWSAKTDRGTVLTAELNALASGGYSALGSEIDNSVNRDKWGAFEIVLAALDPAAGAFVELLIVPAIDGANYADAPGANNLAFHYAVATVTIDVTNSAKRATSQWVPLPPSKFKVVLLSQLGVAMNAAGNSVRLYTANEEVQ